MPIHGRFENKLIAWIAQLRAPDEMRFDRNSHRDDGIDKYADLIEIETRRKPMLGEPASRFVFKRKSDIGNHRDPPAARGHQERG